MTGARGAVLALGAAILLNLPLGSLYAFSLFLEPLQRALGAGRGEVSAVFSLATVAFTAAMLLTPTAYGRARPGILALLGCALGAAGLAIAAFASGVVAIALGYGVMFGAASGIGYSVALQAVNHAMPDRRGLATGIAVAAYGAGAVLFAPLFRLALGEVGLAGTFLALCALLLLAGLAATVLLGRTGIGFDAIGTEHGNGTADVGGMTVWLLWAGFLFGAAAGLMAIGHAAAIVTATGGGLGMATTGAVLIALGNAAGRLGAGTLADRMPVRAILMAAALLAAAALAGLALFPGPVMALAALSAVGLAYGAMAGGYPAAVAVLFGVDRVGRVYGRVFTAWGLAGLTAPWVAGALFDATGGYGLALALAAAAALASFAASAFLPRAASVAHTPGHEGDRRP